MVGSYKLVDFSLIKLHNHPESAQHKTKQSEIAQPITRVSGSVDLRWDLRACITNRLPGGAEAAALEPHFEEI